MVAALLQQPQAAKALMEKWVHLYGVSDKQAFLGNQALQMAMQQVQMQQMMAQAPVGSGISGPDGMPMNPPSGAVDPGRQLPQERGKVM